MSVGRKHYEDESSQRSPARIDVLPLPPIELIPAATAALIAEVSDQLKRFQTVFSNKRTDHPTSFAELQRMFTELFPAVNMERPIDFAQVAQCSTLQLTEDFWRVRREVHLKMADATLSADFTNSQRGPAAREALLGKDIPYAKNTVHIDGLLDVRRKMDERLSGVTIPDQLQHTLYVVRLTDGVLASSRAEKGAGPYLNQGLFQKIRW